MLHHLFFCDSRFFKLKENTWEKNIAKCTKVIKHKKVMSVLTNEGIESITY